MAKVALEINGKEQEFEGTSLTYEELVEMAGMTGTPTMTIRKRIVGGGEASGELLPRRNIALDKDCRLIVNVVHTGDA
jgi:hypothetical protein